LEYATQYWIKFGLILFGVIELQRSWRVLIIPMYVWKVQQFVNYIIKTEQKIIIIKQKYFFYSFQEMFCGSFSPSLYFMFVVKTIRIYICTLLTNYPRDICLERRTLYIHNDKDEKNVKVQSYYILIENKENISSCGTNKLI